MVETMERLKPLYRVKLIESGRSHFYQVEGDENWLPGVTTVLGAAIPKPALLPWALNMMADNVRTYLTAREEKPFTKDEIETLIKEGKNIYKKKSEEAADIGTRVHQAIDDLIHGKTPTITEDIKAGVEGFQKWQEEHKLKVELGDTKLASKLFKYGGSLDFIAFDNDGGLVIFDVKTTKKRKDRDHGIYPEYAYQLGAYKKAFEETYGLPVKDLYALWVNKEKPEFKPVRVINPDICFEGFLAALKLYSLSKWEKFDETA